MNKQMKAVYLTLICVFLFWAISTPAAKLYKWVDEKGVVHFSDRLPEGHEEIKGTIEEREIGSRHKVDTKATQKQGVGARSPIEYAANCTFTIKGSKQLGTGFFISPKGFAVTCRHVIEGDSRQFALLNNQMELPITIISKSPYRDLALILVSTSGRNPFLSLRNSGNLIPGERLFTVGSSAGLQATITDGVFTGFRKIKYDNTTLVQFSAPVNPGSSGGPLVDEKGAAVGVVSLKFLKKEGIPVSGVGFAVPSEHISKEFSMYLSQ